jgi:hypothetical protein
VFIQALQLSQKLLAIAFERSGEIKVVNRASLATTF